MVHCIKVFIQCDAHVFRNEFKLCYYFQIIQKSSLFFFYALLLSLSNTNDGFAANEKSNNNNNCSIEINFKIGVLDFVFLAKNEQCFEWYVGRFIWSLSVIWSSRIVSIQQTSFIVIKNLLICVVRLIGHLWTRKIR